MTTPEAKSTPKRLLLHRLATQVAKRDEQETERDASTPGSVQKDATKHHPHRRARCVRASAEFFTAINDPRNAARGGASPTAHNLWERMKKYEKAVLRTRLQGDPGMGRIHSGTKPSNGSESRLAQ